MTEPVYAPEVNDFQAALLTVHHLGLALAYWLACDNKDAVLELLESSNIDSQQKPFIKDMIVELNAWASEEA